MSEIATETIAAGEPQAHALGADDIAILTANAASAAAMLKLLANEKRLLILCMLAVKTEATVTMLAGAAGLSQSAVSQHLARMRDEGLVRFRKDAQTAWYRISDPNAAEILACLKRIYCP